MEVIKVTTLGLGSAQVLGKGEFAKVFRVELAGQQVAVKQASPSPHAKRSHRRELDALQRLSHPNIVRLLAATDDGRCLVLELCKGGTLEERLESIRAKRSNSRGKSRRQVMPVRRIVQVALELMRGARAMHDAGLCHGDVKSANILLATTAVTAKTAGVKLADLGFVRHIGDAISEEDGGSTPFIPRELQLGLESVARAAHDIYACGVALLDLLCTSKPYEDLTVREFEEAVEEGTLYARGSVPLADFRNTTAADALADLVFEMVSHDPDARPTAEEAVRRLEELAAAMDGSKEAARTARRCGSPMAGDSSGTVLSASGSMEVQSPSIRAFEPALPSTDSAATVAASTRASIDACVSFQACVSVDRAASRTPSWEDHMGGYIPVPQADTEPESPPAGDTPADMATFAPLSIDGPIAQGSGHLADSGLHSAPPPSPSMERPHSRPAAPMILAEDIPQQSSWTWSGLTTSVSDLLTCGRVAACWGLCGGRRATRSSYEEYSSAPAGWNRQSDDMSARSAISEVLFLTPRLEDLGRKSADPPAPERPAAEQKQ